MAVKEKLLSLGAGLGAMFTTLSCPDALSQSQLITNQVTYSFQTEGAYGPSYGYGNFNFYANNKPIFSASGGGGNARGFNVIQLNKDSKDVESIKNYDTWGDPSAHLRLQNDIRAMPSGNYIYLGVTDEAGLNVWDSCDFKNSTEVSNSLALLVSLGSQQITNICYRDGWAMFIQKDNPIPLFEQKSTPEIINFSFSTSLIYPSPYLSIESFLNPNENGNHRNDTYLKVNGPASLDYKINVSNNLKDWQPAPGDFYFDHSSAKYRYNESAYSIQNPQRFFKLSE